MRLEVVKAVCEAAADNFDAVPKQVYRSHYSMHVPAVAIMFIMLLLLFQLWEDLQEE